MTLLHYKLTKADIREYLNISYDSDSLPFQNIYKSHLFVEMNCTKSYLFTQRWPKGR